MTGELALLPFFGIFFLIFLIIGIFILGFIFWVWSIIDISKRKFKNENDKIVWILVVIFLGVIGTIIYYFVEYVPNKKKKKK